MFKHFRYKNWIRLLLTKGTLPRPQEPFDWETLKASNENVLISLPNDSRHIHVVNHALSQLLPKIKTSRISVLVPPAFGEFISGMSFYHRQIVLPPVKPLTFPIIEDMLPNIPDNTYDITLDLNADPYLLSHYIVATRAGTASLGFENAFTPYLFRMTYKLGQASDYDKGFQSLLTLAGLEV